jgi:hypothetical protein
LLVPGPKDKVNYLRARVTPGLSLYKEYLAHYLAENHFDQILP